MEPLFISVEGMFIAVERLFFCRGLGGTLKTTKLGPKLWECLFEVETGEKELSSGGAHKNGK